MEPTGSGASKLHAALVHENPRRTHVDIQAAARPITRLQIDLDRGDGVMIQPSTSTNTNAQRPLVDVGFRRAVEVREIAVDSIPMRLAAVMLCNSFVKLCVVMLTVLGLSVYFKYFYRRIGV